MDFRLTTGWFRVFFAGLISLCSITSFAETYDLGTLQAGATLQRGPDEVRSLPSALPPFFTIESNTYTFSTEINRNGLLYATIKAVGSSSSSLILPTNFSFGGEDKGSVVSNAGENSKHILSPAGYFQPYLNILPGDVAGEYSFTVFASPSSGVHSYEVEVGWLDPRVVDLGEFAADDSFTEVFSLTTFGVWWFHFQLPEGAYPQSLKLSVTRALTNRTIDTHLVGETAGLQESDTTDNDTKVIAYGEASASGTPVPPPGAYTLIITGQGSDFENELPGIRSSTFIFEREYSSFNSCTQYESTRRIASMKWHLLSVPCNAPSGTTMADLTSMEEQEGIDPPWDAFVYNPGVGYDPLTKDSPIPDAGTGFWLISSIDDLTLQMPPGSTPVQNMAGADPCEPGRRCAMATVSHDNWNLTGNPLNYNLDYAGLRLTNDDSQCIEGMPCTPNNSDDQADAALFFYNELLGAYVPFSEANTQVAIPWDGFWARITAPTAVDPIGTPWQLYSHEYPSQFMFVTDGVFDTDLRDEVVPTADSGFEAAHTICQAEADAAALPGVFRAWVDAPLFQYTSRNTPYITPQGKQIAGSFDDLTDGTIDVPVNVMADGTTATGIGDVLTGLTEDGTPGVLLDNCEDWTFSGVDPNDQTFGTLGRMSERDSRWTVNSDPRCEPNIRGRLYCVSQGRPLTPR